MRSHGGDSGAGNGGPWYEAVLFIQVSLDYLLTIVQPGDIIQLLNPSVNPA